MPQTNNKPQGLPPSSVTVKRLVTESDRVSQLSELEKRLLNDYQRGFPLSPTPYAEIARELGTSESEVLACLHALQERGMVSRVGPVFAPGRAGASTLAAIAVPKERLAEVARLINAYDEVNHNYEREHEFNLWFVITAGSRARVGEVLDEIRAATGLQVLDLPMEAHYHIDLGFPLWC